MTYDQQEQQEQQDQQLKQCDCCGKKVKQLRFTLYCKIDTYACAECFGYPADEFDDD